MTNLPERREMRISDAERDQVAAILREAAGEGRLGLDELDERLTAVYAAKTYGELEPITRDLPEPATRPAVAQGDRFGGTPGTRTFLGIMSGFQRKGAWVVPEDLTAIAFWGGGQLDLREARFESRQVTIRAFAVMGGMEIIVPEDAEVHVNGIGIMGGFDHRASGVGAPGAPKIIITGFAFWGGVGVTRKATDAERRRRDLEERDAGRRSIED
ncbi:DUF1707 SHOCT-like domain-containing protein [Actinoallomurus sp. CA-150999]|uniref:DUF1707 SHOCT-like domain-containing protein n=1 Tax=Actinoallomurus sp. CA-150999 TaxID=3239887 RepID=UPI003D9377DB